MDLTGTAPGTLSLDRVTVPLGQNFTVTWDFPDASSCEFGQGAAIDTSGSFTTGADLGSAGTVVDQLYCSTPKGDITQSVVELIYLTPPTVSISVSPASITVGGSTSLTWSSTHADTCEASQDWSTVQSTSGMTSQSPAAAGNYNYTITCTNGKGSTSATASLAVAAKAVASPPPTGGSGGGGADDAECLLVRLGITVWRFRRLRENV
jgi:hypothetical protein